MTRAIKAEDIDNMTRHHPPESRAEIDAHVEVRQMFNELAHRLNELLPEGDAKNVCIKLKVRDAQMWANASIACDWPEED